MWWRSSWPGPAPSPQQSWPAHCCRIEHPTLAQDSSWREDGGSRAFRPAPPSVWCLPWERVCWRDLGIGSNRQPQRSSNCSQTPSPCGRWMQPRPCWRFFADREYASPKIKVKAAARRDPELKRRAVVPIINCNRMFRFINSRGGLPYQPFAFRRQLVGLWCLRPPECNVWDQFAGARWFSLLLLLSRAPAAYFSALRIL